MSEQFVSSNKKVVQEIVEICLKKGIQNVVISPGSRNSPLTIGFVERKKFDCISIVDERSAGFVALGIAQQSKLPTLLICTSGSALLNYYPAIAEAYYQNIPLIVLSADRPKEMIDQADGQTIRQEYVFRNHIKTSVNLEEHNPSSWYNQRLINEAINTSLSGNKGPVHINIPFSEPLYEQVSVTDVPVKIIDVLETNDAVNHDTLVELANRINRSKKVLLISGTNHPDQLLDNTLSKLLEFNNINLLTETTSNIYSKKSIPCIDKIINTVDEDTLLDLQPDLLISFGGPIVSKKVKNWLRTNQPNEHWLISNTNEHVDTFKSLQKIILSNPVDFFGQLGEFLESNGSNYQNTWQSLLDDKNKLHHEYLSSCEYSDLKVFNTVFNNIEAIEMLQLSNSSVIRYAQLFDNKLNIPQYANRGTSGIDGSTSTAVGASYYSKKNTLLITGDLSFFYDINGLWNSIIPNNFKIIVINNGGGGIFKFIPGPNTTTVAPEFIETQHNRNAKHLAEHFGFEYLQSANEEELTTILPSFMSGTTSKKILEVFTPRDLNDKVLKDYFKHLR